MITVQFGWKGWAVIGLFIILMNSIKIPTSIGEEKYTPEKPIGKHFS